MVCCTVQLRCGVATDSQLQQAMYMAKPPCLQFGARRLCWSATTFRSRSAINLVNAIEQEISSFPSVPTPAKSQSPVLLFTISKHIPPELLAQLVDKFQNLVPQSELIGALVQDSSPGCFSISIAKWSGFPNEFVSFTSTAVSRTPIAVGREVVPIGKSDFDKKLASSDHPLDPSLTTEYKGEAHQINESPGAGQLPLELQNIPSAISTCCAPAPQPFMRTLKKSFPSANLMGLIGSSTVFQTGRRSTLFRNRLITGEEGAVGIAILDQSNASLSNSRIHYPVMTTLGAPMRVTQSKGNIILTLDSRKATGCLLEIIEKSSMVNQLPSPSKLILPEKKQFYLGFLDGKNQITEVNRITGGSTSRGTMSLDRDREIPHNHLVQLIHFPENSNVMGKTKQSNLSQAEKKEILIEFECNQSSDVDHSQNQFEEDVVERIDGLFSASSEFGFVPHHQQIIDINFSKAVLQLTS